MTNPNLPMATTHLHSHLTPPFSLSTPPHTTVTTRHAYVTIRCGPRSNRGPLVKGRVLSIEAIQAVQSLKRAHKSSPPLPTKPILTRLIKSDLIATLRELLRQSQCTLALHVFSALRSDPTYTPDLGLYSDIVLALDANGMKEDIDRVVEELETDGAVVDCCGPDGKRGLGRLIRAVIGAGRRGATVGVYRVMKRSGWGESGGEVDEYVAKVLSKGLRRLGEVDLAREVESTLENYLNACLGKVEV